MSKKHKKAPKMSLAWKIYHIVMFLAAIVTIIGFFLRFI